MQWYYAGKDGQVGPVSAGEFQSLVNNGTIKSTTLVWNSTMTDWQEYSKVGGGSTVRPSAAEGGEKLFCSECGKAFSQDDMIRFGNSWVCASCKPVFVQKLKEGVITSASGMDYAGFWIRFGASFIDGIIMSIVNLLLSIPIFISAFTNASSNGTSGVLIYTILKTIIYYVFCVTYETFFIGKYGATPGKMLCKLKVVTPEGDKITYLRAFGRYFAKILSAIILLIGYIMAAFDDEKRALHDRICDTRVIRQ
jgi:uncharacterized RDD family membrane protein YckC